MKQIYSVFSKLLNSKKKSSSHRSPPASDDESSIPKSVLSHRDYSPLPSSAKPNLFNFFNSRRSNGKIKKTDLEALLRRLEPHCPPTDEEFSSIVDEIYLNGDGYISIDELGAIFPEALRPPVSGDNELCDTFSIFDANGDGKISVEELHAVFIAIGYSRCTVDDCRRMIRGVDADGDGFVCFGEFVRMMDGQR